MFYLIYFYIPSPVPRCVMGAKAAAAAIQMDAHRVENAFCMCIELLTGICFGP